MYEAWFKLQCRPFLPAPQVSRYFPAEPIEIARQTLARSVERGEGPGLLIGSAGTGKSLLCRLLAEEFRDRFAVVLLESGRVATQRALLQEILYRLELPYRGLGEGELRLSLLDFLEPESTTSEGLLLLVDEAHTLPLRLLEELRMLTNLVRDGKPRVRVVLAGSPLLEERFASPKLSSFSQRVAARCYLEPLDSGETAAYVRAQISACGGDASRLVDERTLASVYRASDGIPRLINQICDHAMILSSLGGLERLSSEAIDEAWADLQQLPPPRTVAVADTDAGDNVVEFGSLEDDDEPEAIPFHTGVLQHPREAPADEQLDVIEHRLSEIDESFGSRAPVRERIALDSPELVDELGEEFEDEEVVLDRYASDYEIFAEIPRVTAWDYQPLGARVAPIEPAASRPPEPQYKPVAHAGPSDDEPLPMVSLPPVAAFSGGPIVSLPVAPLAPSDEPPQRVETPPMQPADREAAATGDELTWLGAKVTPQTRDVISIHENLAPDSDPPPPKREYKQLFARLRRN